MRVVEDRDNAMNYIKYDVASEVYYEIIHYFIIHIKQNENEAE